MTTTNFVQNAVNENMLCFIAKELQNVEKVLYMQGGMHTR